MSNCCNGMGVTFRVVSPSISIKSFYFIMTCQIISMNIILSEDMNMNEHLTKHHTKSKTK